MRWVTVSHHRHAYWHPAGCAFVGGQVSSTEAGARVHCEDCHFSGSYLGAACLFAGAHMTLHQCTIQVRGGGGGLVASQAHSAIFHPLVNSCWFVWTMSGGSFTVPAEQARHAGDMGRARA
jgi:hypothetical protein